MSGDGATDILAVSRDDLEQLLARVVTRTQPEFLTIDQAAALVGLGDDSIRRLISGGQITGYRPVRGRVVVHRAELVHYVKSTGNNRPRRGRGKRLD